MQDIEKLIRNIAEVFHAEHSRRGENVVFSIGSGREPSDGRQEIVVPLKTLTEPLDATASNGSPVSVQMFDPHYFEMAVLIERNGEALSGSRPLLFDKTDAETGLTYRVGLPSAAFLANMLRESEDFYILQFTIDISYSPDLTLRGDLVFEELRSRCRFKTIRIESPREQGHVCVTGAEEYERVAASLMFQLSYNLDLSIRRIRSFDDMENEALGHGSFRHHNVKEVAVPRRACIPELVYCYESAISSRSPAAQYLSFYHVAEYFFHEVTERHTVRAVRDAITRAGFSHSRDKDIAQLIGIVVKSHKILPDGSDGVKNEKEALRLTLKEYVKLENLWAALQESCWHNIIEHYRTTTVSFAKGDAKVDLGASDVEQTFRKLADRIYATRNAIVHSKGGFESRYVPFQHAIELSKEVPLMRTVAEEIIQNSASLIQQRPTL